MSDWSTLRKLMWLRGTTGGGGGSPLTVTGATPLLMPGALSKPLRKATFQISPVQAGTGDPSPTNIRAITGHSSMTAWVTGANVCPQLDAANAIKYNGPALAAANSGNGIAVTGQTGSSHACGFVLFKADTFIGKVLYFSCDMTSNGTPRALLLSCDADFSNISTIATLSSSTTASAIVPQTAEGKYLGISLYSTIGTDSYSTVSTYTNISLTMSEPTSYAPYSGTTVSVSFPALGKNLVNPARYLWTNRTQIGLTYAVQIDGSVNISGTATGAGGPTLFDGLDLPNGEYTCFSETSSNIYIAYRKKDKATGTTAGLPSTFTVDGTFYVYANVVCTVAGTYDLTVHPMIVFGNTAGSWEPYTNTVYSGTVDPVTGQGVVTHEAATIDGIQKRVSSVSSYATGVWAYTCTSILPNTTPTMQARGTTISNMFKPGGTGDYINLEYCYTTGPTVVFTLGTEMTVEEANAWLSEHNLFVVYTLATPIPFTVHPQSITPPAGDAYIWADCGGSAEVTYIGKA